LVLRNKHDEKIKITKNFDSDETFIKGNSGMLHQAFLNILSNAYDAIPDGGNIQIGIKGDKTQVVVTFKDDGCGIKKEHLDKIADPFFTTKGPGEGTGLGLSITKTIIEDHGGEMQIESTVSRGTIIHIKLPK